MNRFQTLHSLRILETYSPTKGALDRFLSNYFKDNKSVGSKDRKKICDNVYIMIRFWRVLDHFSIENTWSSRQQLLSGTTIDNLQEQLPIQSNIRYGLNEFTMTEMLHSLGQKKSILQANLLNTKAPVFIRANTLKTDPEHLLTLLPSELEATVHDHCTNCIKLERRSNLFSLPCFQDGLFEMQDVGAQIICNNIKLFPGQLVVDYCSGSGGKALAIAPQLNGKGQIFLHDTRPKALQEAKKRCKRAGIQNAQFLSPEHTQLKKLKNKADVVIVDVPCSGSGTLRRNPESRERITKIALDNVVILQQEILTKASLLVKPNGTLLYITCSLFSRENIQQAMWFSEKNGYKLESHNQFLVEQNGQDGFFVAVFTKN